MDGSSAPGCQVGWVPGTPSGYKSGVVPTELLSAGAYCVCSRRRGRYTIIGRSGGRLIWVPVIKDVISK